MATCQTETYRESQTEIDRLSSLPDHLIITILSLLPTRTAARTSLLSRRFCNLWKASPAVDLSFRSIPFKKSVSMLKSNSYVDMATSTVLSRQPSNPPILRFHLEVPEKLPSGLTPSFICSLMTRACSLGIRHLTIDGCWHLEASLHSVFSITSLESLSLEIYSEVIFPSANTLTRLKSLSIHLHLVHNLNMMGQVEHFFLKLPCLEHLQLTIPAGAEEVRLSSQTINTLELTLDWRCHTTYSVGLFMPSLEFLNLANLGYIERLPRIHGGIPSLRKSVITLNYLHPEHVAAVAQLLNCISQVEELSLHLGQLAFEYPFCVLLEPGEEAPAYPNLKHLDAHMCFHEPNFEGIVSLLHRSPALLSLKLVHLSTKRKRSGWRTKLPRNSDGNHQYAYFSNLHLKENNERFMKLLDKKST
ncbi:F-box/FBD/LRR protein [Rhynchospora pubera]|uniref:F-box/FBD/LRR protein n=1 Tax=Rhynchospora pubera TaxID=906938 RepID=A0AAV8DZ17_9POAL|nr:F-box/FBD/LRR protein [Rhynchospora pubera]